MNMKVLALIGCLTAIGIYPVSAQSDGPIAEKSPTMLKKHGDMRIDNYFWLKNKSDEKVLKHLKAENAYTESVMGDTKDFQEKLYQEMRARIQEEDQSVPFKKDDYLYYRKTLKGQEYPIHCRKKNAPNSLEEVIVDVNVLGKGKDFIRVSSLAFHFNQDLLAYAVDLKGDRVFTIYFKEMSTGKVLDQKIENVTSNYVWAQSGKILFYAKHDPQTLRSDKIYKYDLEKNESTLVFEEKDEKFEAAVYKGLGKNFIFITSNSTLSSEVRFIKSDKPHDQFKVIAPREKNFEYSVLDGEDRFYVRTNWKAKNFRLMEVELKDVSKKKWKEVIAHRPDVLIEDFEVLRNHLVISERSNGLTQINILKRGEKKGSYINFPDPAYTVSLSENAEYDSKVVRYDFESMNRPSSVFDFDIEKKDIF